MAAGSTYTPIATATSNGSATEFNFTSLPSYTDIVLVFNGSTNASNDIYCRLNSDGANNYSQTRIYGSGSSAASDRSSNADAWSFNIGNTTGAQVIRLNFQNTNQTSTYKTVITRSDNPSYFLGSHVGLWRSTAAITSIRIFTTNSFANGTTATIYGIAAA